MDIVLTPGEVKQFKEALISAFRRAELEQVVYYGLEVRFDDIVPTSTFDKEVSDLVMWVNDHNKVEPLLKEARSNNPDNPTLRDFDVYIKAKRPGQSVSTGQTADPLAQVEAAAPDLLTISRPFLLDLIRIPAGEFLMGSDPGRDMAAYDYEQPQHPVPLPEYYIGKVPVTNAQYAVFVQAQGYKPPEHWEKGGIPAGKRQDPVVYVSWHDALAFCTWLSERTGREFRLPGEAEWEKAARGVHGRIYPWGDKITPEYANYEASGVKDTSAVGRYPKGASPYGVMDMAGNVWECCLTKWRDDYILPPDEDAGGEGRRVVRGGSFRSNGRSVRCAYRNRDNPDNRSDNLGFRVVCVSPPHHASGL